MEQSVIFKKVKLMGGVHLLFYIDYIFLQGFDCKGNGDFPCWLRCLIISHLASKFNLYQQLRFHTSASDSTHIPSVAILASVCLAACPILLCLLRCANMASIYRTSPLWHSQQKAKGWMLNVEHAKLPLANKENCIVL